MVILTNRRQSTESRAAAILRRQKQMAEINLTQSFWLHGWLFHCTGLPT